MKRIVLFVLMSISFVVSAATITNYDFSVRDPGSNIFAYKGTYSGRNPPPANNSSPSVAFSPSDYANIESNNNTYHRLINYTRDLYPATRYVVALDEVADTITELNFFWNGYGVNSKNNQTDGVVIYIWNNNNNRYDYLMHTVSGGIVELDRSLTSNLTDYIDSNNQVTLYVVSQDEASNNQTNEIGTDYFRLSVTASSVATLIAEYRFDECLYEGRAFEVIDQTGNFSAESFSNLDTSIDAQIERAANISDAAHHIETSIPISGNFSVATWFKKPTARSGNRYMVLGAMANGGGDLLYLDRDNNYQWGVYDGSRSSSGNFRFGNLSSGWHHMVLVYGANTTTLFIDGEAKGSIGLKPSGTLKYIGTSYDEVNSLSPQGFRTALDEFKVYDQALTNTEINTIYSNELARNNADGTGRIAVHCPVLIAQFSMDEISWNSNPGQVVDETGNFSASAINGTTTEGSSPALTGNPGTCRYGLFDGRDDYIQINDDNRLDLETELSISVWINPKTMPSSGLKTIISKDENYEFHLQPSGEIFWWWQTHSFATSGAGITAGNWFHIAITYKSGQQVIYVNGIEKGTRTFTGNLTLNNDPLQIGQDQGSSGRFFEGYIDEVHIYDGALTATEINELYAKRQVCETIHHFEIIHDGQGLTCLSEPLTLKACADEACTATIDTPTEVQIFAGGELKQTVTVIGETSTSFNHLVEETITLSADQNYTCKNGRSTSCDISFANAGFVLDINSGADALSCDSVNFAIKAVKLSDSGESCAPAFTGSQNLEFSFNYSNPLIGGKQPVLDGTAMASAGESQTRAILFDENGEASLPIAYDDAGTLSFSVSEKISSGVSSTTVNKDFYPSRLVLTAKKTEGALLNNTTASDEPKQVAGDDFYLNFIGQCSNNTETPNYQPQEANDLALAVKHIAPSSHSSALGKLTVGDTSMTASNSANPDWETINATDKQLVTNYDEVGIISVNIKDNDYLGNVINATGFLDIGRFTPSYFDITVTNNSFENICMSDDTPFTYVGQPFKYSTAPIITITAKNAAGFITKNYTDTSFQKLVPADVILTFATTDSAKNEADKNGADLATKMIVEPTTSPGSLGELSKGVLDYTFSTLDTFTFTKGPYSQVTEFMVNYNILIDRISDSDGVGINVLTPPLMVQPTGGFQRFGRLVLSNSFGPEISSIDQYFDVEYLNISGKFERNKDDNCTLITADEDNWSFTDPTGEIAISDISISGTGGSFKAGNFQNISLLSENKQGTIDIKYTAPSWLQFDWLNGDNNFDGPYNQNPSATATFGVYRGNDRIISWREIGN
ncbi:MAG: LamG domain-containing protein [Colwellia sp.]